MFKRKPSFYPPPKNPVSPLCAWIILLALVFGLAFLCGMCIAPVIGP